MKHASLLLIVLGALSARAVSAETPGPAVGKKAPAFKLKDQKAKEQSLETLFKKRNVALVFYRSADW